MSTPLLALEGPWEEIAAQIPNASGQKLRVLVYPAAANSPEAHDTRPMAEVLTEIAATSPAAELATLPPDHLRGKALQTVRAILANVHVTVRPQTRVRTGAPATNDSTISRLMLY
jgi:hypothetical protein